MIEIHEKQEMIDEEEGDILRGAMTYRSKTAKSVMTPASQLFMLPR
jgi:metal transporter CNNM